MNRREVLSKLSLIPLMAPDLLPPKVDILEERVKALLITLPERVRGSEAFTKHLTKKFKEVFGEEFTLIILPYGSKLEVIKKV